MSDGITDAVTYSQQSFNDWKKREIQTFLSLRSTKELVDELSKREGVWHDMVTPNGRYEIHIIDDREDITKKDFGPARILAVTD